MQARLYVCRPTTQFFVVEFVQLITQRLLTLTDLLVIVSVHVCFLVARL